MATKICKMEDCECQATEANGMCFACAEEMAWLMYDAVIESGGTRRDATMAAEMVWKVVTMTSAGQ